MNLDDYQRFERAALSAKATPAELRRIVAAVDEYGDERASAAIRMVVGERLRPPGSSDQDDDE